MMMMMKKMIYYAASIYNELDFASSSDFVVKTHDSDPILISLVVGASGIIARKCLGSLRIGISFVASCVSHRCVLAAQFQSPT